MSAHTDITDYNYFDVEDFSVDSFFRSLELQSRFAPSDLEFSFPSDLENVPISSCLGSVGFLDSTTAKSTNTASELSVAGDGGGCSSGLTEGATETSIADDNDDDNATAVDVFFRSLQLRSCLLRSDDETIPDSSHGRCDKADPSSGIADLFSSTTNSEEKNNRTMSSDCNRVVDVCHGRQSSGYLLEKSPTDFDCLSSTWSGSSLTKGESCHAVQQLSTTHVSQSAVSIRAEPQFTRNSFSSFDCSEPCDPATSADQTEHSEDRLCGQDQRDTATTKDDTVGITERRASLKGGKMSCKVCGVELSSKYSYVRHLLTPLHCRRAAGYCVTSSSATATTTTNTEDVVRLISRQKPIQCRVCRFYGDTSSQLLYHLTTTYHYSRVKRKLVRCSSCRFVGTSDDIVAHLKSDAHTALVKQSSRPSVISIYRSHGRRQQAVCCQTKDDKSCSDCGMKFPSASSLEIHIRRRHTGHRPFTCSVCSKSYCDNSTLRLHYKTAQHKAKCAVVL